MRTIVQEWRRMPDETEEQIRAIVTDSADCRILSVTPTYLALPRRGGSWPSWLVAMQIADEEDS